MAIIKCKMCGGDIVLHEEKTFGTCEYCGSTMTLPKVSDEQRAALFNRGNHFRRAGEFDKALAIYENIVREDDTDAEAHWCCALCRFGIEYVEDPNTYEFIPTCHRASFDSFLEDVDYIAALEHSDGITRRQYQKDAAKIAEVQRGILATSQNEEPFDVFICYKETDDITKERTKDSIDAQEIYYQLTNEGYRVFFSRITLEDKAGAAYEPYIFAALNSAKVMVAIGSKPEYFNAVWVKNEWSRFLALMRKDRSKLLIPCYKNMDPYDLPEQLSVLQSYDMTKIGFMQDLIRGIKKVVRKDETDNALLTERNEMSQSVLSSPSIDSLLKRAEIFLSQQDWKKAAEYYDKILDLDPENGDAYIGLMLAKSNRSKDAYEKAFILSAIDPNSEYELAKRFAFGSDADWFQMLEQERKNEEEKARKAKELKHIELEEAKIRLKLIRDRISPLSKLISSGDECTLGVRTDGTVVATKYTKDKSIDPCRTIQNWNNIAAVSAGVYHTIGLQTDGSVVASGNRYFGQCDVSNWKDIVSVSAGLYHTVGLKADGTVIATKYTRSQENYNGQCEVSGWKNIVSISAGSYHTVGLKADGSVVATRFKGDPELNCGQCEVSGWKDIVSISAGNDHTVGLKADGTIIATRYRGEYDFGQYDFSDWNDIVSISVGGYITIGLKANGMVVANGINTSAQNEISHWKDIVAVSAGKAHVVGLRTDGTVVAAKCSDYYHVDDCGQTDVSGWKLFTSPDTLEEERLLATKRIERERMEIEEKNRKEAEERAKKEKNRQIEQLNSNISSSQQKKASVEAELANLKGLFSGKRRRELEGEIASLDAFIKKLQKQLNSLG